MAYVLIIDDDPDLSECNAETLKRAGYEVRVAATPQAGMAALKERHPDLILLDVMFPDNDTGGFELARKIPLECPKVPILMMTAVNRHFPLNFSNKDKDPLWLPIAEFLDKPVEPQVLVEKVKQLIQAAQQT
jgi:DNA-binding response OmpR family regulator